MANPAQLEILKPGVEGWNAWRRGHPFEEIDLRGVDLYRANLHEVDLRTADLRGADLNETILIGADLSLADMRGINMSGANLEGARLVHAYLSQATITGVQLYGTTRDDWQIDGIVCDYIYLDEQPYFSNATEAQQWRTIHRFPKDRNFRPGEFEELYKQLPTFEYVFEHSFTPVNTVVMARVVEAINEEHPEFKLDLINFDKRGEPHATFTVVHQKDIEAAKAQVTATYERRILALEAQKDQLMQVVKMLGSGGVILQAVTGGVNVRHALSPALTQQIVEFLCSLPGLEKEDARRAWIYSAGLDASLQQQIQVGGAPIQFFQLLVQTAVGYGKLHDGRFAIQAILTAAKGMIGPDRQAYCDTLMQQIEAEWRSWH